MFRMTRGQALLLGGGCCVLAAGASARGVQGNGKASVTPTNSSAAPVSAAASGPTTSGATPLASLNQLTVADLVAAFQQFLTQLGSASTNSLSTNAAVAGLSAEQLQQLQGFQAQLDGEEITEEAFADRAHGILGNASAASPSAFGVLGGLHHTQQAAGTSDLLNLTAEQQQQAQDIATRLHDDIAQLRQHAHDLIFSVLTPDQQTQLTGSNAGQAAPATTPTTAKIARHATVARSQASTAVTQGTTATVGAQNSTPATGASGGSSGAVWQNPMYELQLTDAQKAQIELIRADLRVAVQARHQQARDEFFAILTPEQQALLYAIEQSSGAGV
jgi:Spy/CpxP family protein refolding chaperone